MAEKETSGAPQNSSPTPKATGAAPGGSSFPSGMPPAFGTSRCRGLCFLIAILKEPRRTPLATKKEQKS
jgi:hypothetical protein